MIDERAVAEIPWLTAGVYTNMVLLGLLIWRAWNSVPAFMGRWIELRKARAEERTNDINRLREEIVSLWEEHHSLREKVQACEEREAEWMRRCIVAEATMMGMGKAEQEAARIVAVERLKKDEL